MNATHEAGQVAELTVDGGSGAVYAEGWQSWSPTRLLSPRDPGARPANEWQAAMRFRPGKRLPENGIHAEGLMVIDPGTGGPVLRVAGTEPDSVPRISLLADADRPDSEPIVVEVDGPVELSEHANTAEALEDFGRSFAHAGGVRSVRPAPRVWCSWYRYFEHIGSEDILENMEAIRALHLPVDVIQIDDGWSRGLGEWNEPSGVPDLPDLVGRIRDMGFRAGIWLAPFLVGAETSLAREHPDWLLGYAGYNWGQDLRGLDLTHPGVVEYLTGTFSWLRDLGVDYFKLDFLYAGALPGERYRDTDELAAYRGGLDLIREAVGQDCHLLGCGAPILPSVGRFDAMRVSPDTFHEGAEDGSAGLRGLPGLAARSWQHGRFWANDPDCLVARPAYALREEWARHVSRFGGLRSSSDRLAELDAWGVDATRTLLENTPPAGPLPRETVVDGLSVSRTAGEDAT